MRRGCSIHSYQTTDYFQVENTVGKNRGKIFDALVWGLIYMDDKEEAPIDKNFTNALKFLVGKSRIATGKEDVITELIITEIRKERPPKK